MFSRRGNIHGFRRNYWSGHKRNRQAQRVAHFLQHPFFLKFGVIVESISFTEKPAQQWRRHCQNPNGAGLRTRKGRKKEN